MINCSSIIGCGCSPIDYFYESYSGSRDFESIGDDDIQADSFVESAVRVGFDNSAIKGSDEHVGPAKTKEQVVEQVKNKHYDHADPILFQQESRPEVNEEVNPQNHFVEKQPKQQTQSKQHTQPKQQSNIFSSWMTREEKHDPQGNEQDYNNAQDESSNNNGDDFVHEQRVDENNDDERMPHEDQRGGLNFDGCNEERQSEERIRSGEIEPQWEDVEPQSKNPFFVVTFPYLKRQNKPSISKNSSKAEINRSLIKRDLEIAAKRKAALDKARNTSIKSKLPGKKASYSRDYISSRRQRSRSSFNEIPLDSVSTVSSYSSKYSTKEPKSRSNGKKAKLAYAPKQIDKELLKSFATRDQEIAKKRQEALSKARATRRKANDITTLELPGKKASFPDASPKPQRFIAEDDVSTSSAYSSRSSSSRIDRLYEIGKKARRTDLERSKAEEKRAGKISERNKDDESLDLETRRTRMYELMKRNRDFASSRRKDIERARTKMQLTGPTIAPCHDDYTSDDSRSVSSMSSSRSTLSTSSRLNQLYEKGKEKRLLDLKKSVKKEDVGILNLRKVESTNRTCNKLYQLSKRNYELGKKRREEIANARISSMRSPRQISNRDAKLNKSRKDDFLDDWFDTPSLKTITSSTEDDKLETSSGEDTNPAETHSSARRSTSIGTFVENNENASSYEFLTRTYLPSNERRRKLKTHLSVR